MALDPRALFDWDDALADRAGLRACPPGCGETKLEPNAATRTRLSVFALVGSARTGAAVTRFGTP